MQFSLSVCALLSAVFASAQLFSTAPYDPSQFSIIGSITGMSLNSPLTAGLLTGGLITVDGIPIIVPDNSIVTLPATAVAWPELFTDGVANLPGSQTWQATVFGNRVNDQYIAGLVYIAQNPLRALQGFISSIDSNTGHFTLAGPFDTGGFIDCVINDPLGVYGPTYTVNPLWSVDPVNPSIHSFTGFPMCIPRSADDPLCPAKNRQFNPNTRFTFGPGPYGVTDPDPNFMAPLLVGDWVTVNGQKIGDLFEVNNLVANLGLYTSPGTKPAYVNVDAVNFGITFPVSPDPPETRAVAFTTDPSTPIQWFAQDVDPCTGVITERNIQLVQPQQGAPIGRATFRMGTTAVTPATRNVGFRMASGTCTTGNNLTAGLFIQPVIDFIFPEITAFGVNVPPLAFDKMPFLTLGSGPYIPGNVLTPLLNDTAPIIGQLSPFPMNPTPASTSCTPITPTSSSTSSSVSPTSTDPPPVDTVTIVSATSTKTRHGSFLVVVTAQTDSLTAILSVAVAGVRPVGASPMTNNGNGLFILTILTKGAPSVATVTSSEGGADSLVV